MSLSHNDLLREERIQELTGLIAARLQKQAKASRKPRSKRKRGLSGPDGKYDGNVAIGWDVCVWRP